MIGLSRPPAPELRALQDSQDRPRLGADGIARRNLLQRGATAALAVGALGVTGIEAVAASGQAQVRRRVAIGKTGLLMPDISMGTGSTRDPAIIRYAYERGMTYFDTAEGYPMKSPGLAEKGIAKALREVGAPRDGVVLASKQVARAHEKRVVMMRRLERSLRRLQTDYVDIYFNHAVNEVARMQNAEWH